MQLFIGIELSQEETNLISPLLNSCNLGKWQNTDDLHITLDFLGETTEQEYQEIVENLADISTPTLNLKFGKLSGFQQQGFYKTIHIDIEDETSNLQILQKEIIKQVDKIKKINHRYPKYNSHATICKPNKQNQKILAAFLEQEWTGAGHTFSVEKFHLYSIDKSKTEQKYSVIESFNLTP